MKTRYIIDIPSNRVIFFTKDETVTLRPGDSAVIYEDMFGPPEGMTLANAWSWKLYGRTFQRMEGDIVKDPDTNVDTLEENKNEVTKALNVSINNSRKRLRVPLDYTREVYLMIQQELDKSSGQQPMIEALAKVDGSTVSEYIEKIKKELDEYNRILIQSEQWKRYYQKKIDTASTVDDLAILRDEIANRNFKVDLF
jgi:hypothetical protein